MLSAPPELPGEPIPRHSDQERWLKGLVSNMCQLHDDRFPGSQPISFSVKDLDRLEREDFWVCEKSDGVRALLLVHTVDNDQTVYLIDRHNTYRLLRGLFFPHHANPQRPLGSTLVDGELVRDVDPRTRAETLRFLAFDCLVVDDANVMSRTLDKRYGRLAGFFHKPYTKMMRDHPHMANGQPFEIKVKEMGRSYAVEKVFNFDIPALQHGNDGLVYTCVGTPYTPGTDHNILKWKPPSENSIDFRLVLRFPPIRGRPTEPDLHAKPVFALHVWLGGDGGEARYEPFDIMHVEDDEWERLKAGGEQIDERVVEVHWDAGRERWRMMRFRDDKPNGNHKSVVDKILQSIADGVEKEILVGRVPTVRANWKQREERGVVPGPAPVAGRPGPPPAAQPAVYNNSHVPGPPALELRYGPLAPPAMSKVAGPAVVAGMFR